MVQSDTNLLGESLFVDLDRASPIPIHVQLEVANAQRDPGPQAPGDSVVPASRRLADHLGVYAAWWSRPTNN